MDSAAHDNAPDIARSPYDHPIVVSEDDYGSPYDGIAGILATHSVYLQRIADASEAQRSNPRQAMVMLSASPNSTTVRYRVTELVITATAATTASLVVGSGVQMTFVFSQADTKRFPYITIFDRGVDLSLTGSGGVQPTGYIIAYPE